MERLPLSAPDIRDEDVAAVTAALRSGMLSKGPWTARLEQEFADYIGVPHAVAVSSGTAGLHLCVRAAGAGDGDEVVTTPFGYVASANSILYERARPVFADIDEASMNLDPVAAAAAITPRTRAILPVHVFGQPAAMGELVRLCEARRVALIEDACEAIGAEHRGRKVGSFGDTAVFSFFPNKQMTTGEGAVITCRDASTARLLRELRNQGQAEDGAPMVHEHVGYNYRMTELSAALGVSQLARIEEMLATRERLAGLYRERLAAIPRARLLAPGAATTRLSWFTAIVRLDGALDRARVIERLARAGVPARPYFEPIHLQPVYRRMFGYAPGDFPIAERVARSTLALPFFNRMNTAQLDRVCDALAEAVECVAA
jgi:perosamine synthetase